MSFETRLKNPEYQNWLKCGHAMQLLVGSLRQFADGTITTFHDQLKAEIGTATCQQQCKPKNKPPDTCQVCCPWRKKLMENHSNKMVFWTNVDPKSWPRDKWEMAKTYMPRGQKPNKPITVDNLDSTHMLNLLKNCKVFHQFLSSKKLPEKVLQKRNELMHSSNMTLNNNSLKDAFDVFLQFLQDKPKLHQLQETQKAVQDIQALRQMTFNISTNQAQAGGQPEVLTAQDAKHIEDNLIKDMMRDFETRLEALENLDTKAAFSASDNTESEALLNRHIEEVQNFVNSNEDLKARFGSDLEKFRVKFDHLVEKVEVITEELGVMNIRVRALEEQPPSEPEISPESEPAGLDPFMLKAIKFTAPVLISLVAIIIALMYDQSHRHSQTVLPAANYKNLLQEIAQDLKIDKPKYECSHDELGQVCYVTVKGIKYKSAGHYNTKREAEQNAASVAYALLKKEKTMKETDVSDDTTNYVGQLQEFQVKRGLPKPTYRNEQADSLQFIATVTVELPDGSQKKFQSPVAEKSVKEAKHGAARRALSELSEQKVDALRRAPTPTQPDEKPEQPNDDTNYKAKLNIHQQRLKLDKATYSTVPDGNKFRSTVTVPVPGGETRVFESDVAEGSKKAAEHRAAKRALTSLAGMEELVQTPAAKPKTETGAIPKAATSSQPSDSTADSSTRDFKGELQRLLQKSHSTTSLPKYEDIEIPSQPGTYKSKVTVNAKYMLQNDRQYSSKKEAEKNVAKRALQQLGIADWDTIENPKGKLQELHPTTKPVYKSEEVQPKQFQCTLVLAVLEEVNEIVFIVDQASKTKKERKEAQQLAAKKVLDLLGEVGKA